MKLRSMRLVKKKTRASESTVSPNDARVANESGESQHERIAELAYARYERSGRHDGYDLADWLEAEQQVLTDEAFPPGR